jgi:predicted AAA+ superfamily ATPase
MAAVISRSTVSADAPEKLVLIEIVGRSTLGSSRTTTPKKAAIPATIISALITTASTGRFTNNAASTPPRSFWDWMDI